MKNPAEKTNTASLISTNVDAIRQGLAKSFITTECSKGRDNEQEIVVQHIPQEQIVGNKNVNEDQIKPEVDKLAQAVWDQFLQEKPVQQFYS